MSKRINVELTDDEYKLLKDTINGTISEYLDDSCVFDGDYKRNYENLAHELMIVYNKIFGKTFSIEEVKNTVSAYERESLKNTLKELVQLNDDESDRMVDVIERLYADEDYRKDIIRRGLAPYDWYFRGSKE